MENNNQDIKLCPVCGAKNKSAYKYCNECGTPLNQSNYTNTSTPNNVPPQASQNGYYGSQSSQNSYTPNYIPYGMNAQPIYEGTPDFYGIPAKDIYEFIGEKPAFFNKLKTEHLSGRTGPYCWPLFILGLIFGFFGMGCWYLYHKMYKPAAALIAGALVQTVTKLYTVWLLFDIILNNFSEEFYNSIVGNVNDPAAIDRMAEALLADSNGVLIFAIDAFSSIVSIAAFVLTIVLPFFAYKQYKNFAINKIRAEYSQNALPNISSAGGSKGGMVALASVLYAALNIIAVIAIIVSFAVGIYQKSMEYSKNAPVYEQYDENPFNQEFGNYEDYFNFDGDSGELW